MDIEKIYRIYFDDLYKFLLSLTKNKEIAQDITSECFLKAMANLDAIKKEKSIKSYLFTIGKNTYIDYYKKNKMLINTDDINKFDLSSPSFEEDLISGEEEKFLKDSIEKLEEPYKSIIKLRIENLSFKNIGKIYGKTDNWACVCFYRAKEKLRKILEEDYGLSSNTWFNSPM